MLLYRRILSVLMVIFLIESILGSSNETKNFKAVNSAKLCLNMRKSLRPIRSDECTKTKFKRNFVLNSHSTSWEPQILHSDKENNLEQKLDLYLWKKHQQLTPSSHDIISVPSHEKMREAIIADKAAYRLNLRKSLRLSTEGYVKEEPNFKGIVPVQSCEGGDCKTPEFRRESNHQKLNKKAKINNERYIKERDFFLNNSTLFLNYLEERTAKSPCENSQLIRSRIEKYRNSLKSFIDSLEGTENHASSSTIEAITIRPSSKEDINKREHMKNKNLFNDKITRRDIEELKRVVNSYLDSLKSTRILDYLKSRRNLFPSNPATVMTTGQSVANNLQPISKDVKNSVAVKSANLCLNLRKSLRPIRSEECNWTKFKRNFVEIKRDAEHQRVIKETKINDEDYQHKLDIYLDSASSFFNYLKEESSDKQEETAQTQRTNRQHSSSKLDNLHSQLKNLLDSVEKRENHHPSSTIEATPTPKENKTEPNIEELRSMLISVLDSVTIHLPPSSPATDMTTRQPIIKNWQPLFTVMKNFEASKAAILKMYLRDKTAKNFNS